MIAIYRGYNVREGRNAFEMQIFVVTKDGSNPLYTATSEDDAYAWIDAHKAAASKGGGK